MTLCQLKTKGEMGSGDGPCCRSNSDPSEKPFLPQSKDEQKQPLPPSKNETGPVGPWAGGQPDWSPSAGTTGIRPAVDQYSITRYSDSEWRKHNEEVLSCTADDLHRVNMAEYQSRRGLECVGAMGDKGQENSAIRLKERSAELLRWKTEMERSIEALTNENRTLEMERRRTNQARSVLGLCRSINSECLKRRAFRDGYDLCRDKIEEELIKEAALIDEVGNLIGRTMKQILEQQARNRAMKEKLESDWSDKNEAFKLTNESAFLKNDTTTIMFKPAAARFPEKQSTGEGWESNCRELLATAEGVRGQSCELRALLEGPILRDAMRDLKKQAETVDLELDRSIADLEQCINAMHQELDVVVRRNAESETLIYDLQQGIRGVEKAMKVAQTRLDNYLHRPGIENCRDKSQVSLLEEVKSLSEQGTALKVQMKEAEEALLSLIHSRNILEKELQNKLKTLDIDRSRCQACREHYPTATAMSGF